MTNKQLSYLDGIQEEKESFGPSTYRIIGKMMFSLGYKVYASGLSNDETFFPFTDDASRKVAEAAAGALNAESGSNKDRSPNVAYNFIAYKDDVLAGAKGWSVNQHFIREKWTEKVVEVDGVQYDDRIVYNSVRPFVQAGKVEVGKPFYGSLKNVGSPFHVRQGEAGKKETWTNAQGDEVRAYPTVKVLDEVFATQAEAQAAAVAIPAPGAESVNDESWPGHFDPGTKWNAADWDTDGKELIMKLLGTGIGMDAVATAVAAPVEAVKLAVAQVEAKGK